jgi:hypothetical protein
MQPQAGLNMEEEEIEVRKQSEVEATKPIRFELVAQEIIKKRKTASETVYVIFI